MESRFDSYLEQENRVNRQKIVDNRVHACLYFIQPTGHSYVFPRVFFSSSLSSRSLKQIDVEFMRRLHTRVNLIPVIAKADTLTDEEIVNFKARVRQTQSVPTARSYLMGCARRGELHIPVDHAT